MFCCKSRVALPPLYWRGLIAGFLAGDGSLAFAAPNIVSPVAMEVIIWVVFSPNPIVAAVCWIRPIFLLINAICWFEKLPLRTSTFDDADTLTLPFESVSTVKFVVTLNVASITEVLVFLLNW